ncbi:hypothetical protein ACK3F5_19205 [Photorhabdus asymbiotica UENP]
MTGVSERSQQSSSLKDEEYKRVFLHNKIIYWLKTQYPMIIKLNKKRC